MSGIAVDDLLLEITPDHPCGRWLEEDNDLYGMFLELEKAAQPGPSRWDGTKEVAGKTPEWPDVERRATELFAGTGRTAGTKDLRIAGYLARARLHVAGLAGLTEGLRLIRGLLERFWDDVHPQVNGANGGDPGERFSGLADFADQILAEVRRTPLLVMPVLGPISYRDIEIAKGTLKPTQASAGTHSLSAAQIDGMFAECAKKTPEQLLSVAQQAREALDEVSGIEALLTDHLGSSEASKLNLLRAQLSTMSAFLAGKLAAHGLASPAQGGPEEAGDGAPVVQAAAATGSAYGVNSREGVLHALDLICDYYDRCEPSSPVPLLLRRARRLVDKTFIDIVKDLAPNAVAQVEQLRGTDSGEEKA